MNELKEHVLGIDIGGTNTKFGLVGESGEVIYRGSVGTKKFSDPNLLLTHIKEAVFEKHPNVRLVGIGIGAPNGNYHTGTIEYAPNLDWKGIIPLKEIAKEVFALPAIISNDANAAAIGEMIFGEAKGMRDFIVITLGTGVGSGIVCNGQLVLGHDGFAGELGHTVVIPGGRLHHSTGVRGSLESYASAGGIVQTAMEFLMTPSESSLREIAPDQLTSKIIFEYARQGDILARKVYEYTGEILGLAIANFVMFSSPEAIILFGGVVNAGDMFMKPVKENMEMNLLPIFRNKVKLIVSSLPQSDSAILGAAALSWNHK